MHPSLFHQYQHWSGMVTPEIIDDVADRIFEMPDGKLYTFVAYNDGFYPDGNTGLDVKVDQYLKKNGWVDKARAVRVFRGEYGPHVSVADSGGTWGFDCNAHIAFEYSRFVIQHKAPAGHNLTWKIVVQKHNSED